MQIRTIVDKSSFQIKTRYMMKPEPNAKWQKISKVEWFKHYDKSFTDSSIEILPPLTVE